MEKESLKIVPLTPEKTNDYLHFFETVLSSDSGEWGYSCYCVSYCGTDNCKAQGFEQADVRRQGAIEYIQDGFLTGYLAYMDGQVVGWCNANDRDASRNCYGLRYLIYGGTVPLIEDDKKIKSVFCFEVAPHMRGRHIATALLERVIADAAQDGYAYVEAYPEKEEKDLQHSYAGHKKFYEKMGFAQCGETECRLVMRKKL